VIEDNWAQIEESISEAVRQLERQKKDSQGKVLLYGTLIALAVFLFICSFAGFNIVVLIFCCVVGYVGIYYYYHNERNKVYKADVMPKLVEAICPGASYSAPGKLNRSIIEQSELYSLGLGENFTNEDTILGKVDKTDFVFGEVELWHMQSSGKSSRKVVDFKGFVFEADFNKHFQGLTLLSTEKIRIATRNLLSGRMKCQLEDVEFEKRFNTYTTNDQEARYILTPALQQRIMEMNDVFTTQLGDSELSMSFHHDRMLIMVPSRTDRFEVKYNLEGVKKDLLALRVLVGIVEMLNLNLRIWTKE